MISRAVSFLFLPHKGDKTLEIRLDAIELTLQHSAVVRAVTAAVSYHYMHLDPCLSREGAGDMEFLRDFRIMFFKSLALH